MSETFATDEMRSANLSDIAAFARPCGSIERVIRVSDRLRPGETAIAREARITLAIMNEDARGILAWWH